MVGRRLFPLAPLNVFAVVFCEIGGVIDVVGVGHVPPERLEIFLKLGGLEHSATMGVG